MLHGTRGSWMKYGADVQERQLVAGMRPDDPAFGIDTDPGIFIDGATAERTELPAPQGNQWKYYEEIADAIRERRPASLTARDAVAVMAILETSFLSGAQGRVLPLPLTDAERAEWQR